MSGAAAVLAIAFGAEAAANALLVLLMRAGLVPADVCAECTDIWARPGMARS